MMYCGKMIHSKVYFSAGSFQTILSFFGVIGKPMKVSGLTEIVIQPGICASVSIEQDFRGNHLYRR